MRARRTRTMGVGAAALLMLATLLPITAAGAADPGDTGLFTPAAEGRTAGLPAHVTRARAVTADVGSLFDAGGAARGRAAMPTVRLNLFADTAYTGVVTDSGEDAGFPAWSGTLEGTERGTFSMVVVGGTFAAHVNDGSAVYEVETSPGGGYRVIEIDQSRFVDHPPGSFDDPIVGEATGPDLRALGRAAPDAGDVIDIMVLYTPAVKALEGGQKATEAMIALALTETNTSYALSGTATRLRMVKVEEVPYTEYAYGDTGPCAGGSPPFGCPWGVFYTSLYDLYSGVGALSGVPQMRDDYRADMVGMIIDDSQYCGLAAGILPGEAYAYQVTDNDCATGNYSFGHEFGHLQGADHDAHVASGGVTIGGTYYDYNLGWVNTSDRWRTIMAYDTQCIATPPYTSCTRLQYWSNPSNDYVPDGAPDGTPADPMGGSTARNYDILDLSASTVANHRKSLGDEFDTNFNGNAPFWKVLDGTWTFLDGKNWAGTIGAGEVASVYHTRRYGDFTFEVQMKREGCASCPNKVILRGKRKNTTPAGDWLPSYVFQWSNEGDFSVWLLKPNGAEVMLQDWTIDPAVQPDKWNDVKVVVVDNRLSLYFNGTKVWNARNNRLDIGQVGIGFYGDGSPGDRLLVNWATLEITPINP